MEKYNFNFESVTDAELLNKVIFYLVSLSSKLPTNMLKDTCAGARASLSVLRRFFIMGENCYGNY